MGLNVVLSASEIAAIAARQPVHSQAEFDNLPPSYGMRECVGHCMEPFILHGSKLAFTQMERVEAGDVAAIYWAAGKNAPGSFQIQVKQILVPKAKDGTFVFRMFRPYTVRAGRLSDTLGMHKCIGYRRPDGSIHEVDFGRMLSQCEFVRAS